MGRKRIEWNGRVRIWHEDCSKRHLAETGCGAQLKGDWTAGPDAADTEDDANGVAI